MVALTKSVGKLLLALLHELDELVFPNWIDPALAHGILCEELLQLRVPTERVGFDQLNDLWFGVHRLRRVQVLLEPHEPQTYDRGVRTVSIDPLFLFAVLFAKSW